MAHRGTTAHIDIAELEKLCAMQCTDEEIAAWFGVTRKTIERRRKVGRFAEIMARGKAKGRISVRRMQMKLLEQGNATMGVWLGKQLLGQTDHLVTEVRQLPSLRDLTTAELSVVLNEYIVARPELAAEVLAIDADFVVEPPPTKRSGLLETQEQPDAKTNLDRD